MSYNTEQSLKKREKFANEIRSQQRKRIFAEGRRRLEQARRLQDEAQIAQAELQLLEVFDNNKEELEWMLQMAQRLQKQEKEYFEYMQKLQEESINFERLQKKREIEQLKQHMLQHFEMQNQ